MNFFARAIRKLCWTVFPILPKNKHKAVFESMYGRGYSDSPKSAAEAFNSRGGYKLYWVIKDKKQQESLPGYIIPVKQDSVRSIWHYATAGIWVDNCRKQSFVNKGKGQLYIQTWHGFPLKRIEKDAENVLDQHYINSAKKDSAMCDLMLSNGSFMTGLYKNSFWYDGEVLEEGFPRNDVLVKGDTAAVSRAVTALKLSDECNYILYAPTFRRGMGLEVYDMDYERCVKAFEHRFGGSWMVLAKLHPNIASKANEMKLNPRYVKNVSDYSDIQDLYLLAKGMVTDYSSVMFDFMVTGKPCFLYVNDLKEYKEDRNFYYDIDKLPFVLAQNNEELENAVAEYDGEIHKKRSEEFCREFGIKESGRAGEAVVLWTQSRRF